MVEFKAAKVPPDMKPIFARAEELISDFFAKVVGYPDQGRIEIDGIRYMWARADGLGLLFRDLLTGIYGERGADHILYQFGQALGRNEARGYIEKFGLQDPIEKLSAGPVYFSYSGWAFVDILPQSAPSPDENYVLTYHHPNSFEAEAMLSAGRKADRPICYINAGYSSGWCSESFGVPLDAREITCEAAGDEHCTFLMTHRSKLYDRLSIWKEKAAAGQIPTIEELLSV